MENGKNRMMFTYLLQIMTHPFLKRIVTFYLFYMTYTHNLEIMLLSQILAWFKVVSVFFSKI